ncbi:hypothetical protein B0H11DRAFT_1917527 [Mycena galericulata]|nr:hypothetical protein B0H11DRAFT_1917527 [Mycena galericulata]
MASPPSPTTIMENNFRLYQKLATVPTFDVDPDPSIAYPLDSDGLPILPEQLASHAKTHKFELPRCFHGLEATVCRYDSKECPHEDRIGISCPKSIAEGRCNFHIDLSKLMYNYDRDLMLFRRYPSRGDVDGEATHIVTKSASCPSFDALSMYSARSVDEGDPTAVTTGQPPSPNNEREDSAVLVSRMEAVSFIGSESTGHRTPAIETALETDESTDNNRKPTHEYRDDGHETESDDDLPPLVSPSEWSTSSVSADQPPDDATGIPAEKNVDGLLRCTEALRHLTDTMTTQMKRFVLTHPHLFSDKKPLHAPEIENDNDALRSTSTRPETSPPTPPSSPDTDPSANSVCDPSCPFCYPPPNEKSGRWRLYDGTTDEDKVDAIEEEVD